MTKSEFEKILTECCTELTKYMDDSLFVEYWGESVPPEKRIKRWLEKADELATEWVPSQSLFLKKK